MKKVLFTAILFFTFVTMFCVIDVNAATSNVSIKSVKNTKTGIEVKWKSKTKASGYIIYRSENDSNFEKYDETRSKKYKDTNIETGSKYKYKVKSYSYSNYRKKYKKISSSSKEIIANPIAVTGGNAYEFTDGMYLSWKKNAYASGYDIYRSTDNKNWEYLSSVDYNVNTFYDYIDDWSFKYSYKIKVYEYVDGIKYESVFSSVIKPNGSKGIDVSYHNGKINWKKVKASGKSFAMIRLGYGDTSGGATDSQLDYNYKNAKKYGMKIGFYFYSYATSTAKAKKEAKYTYNLLKKYPPIEYPVAFDFENQSRNKKKYKKSNTKIITTYCDYLEKKGYDTCIYSYKDFLKKSTDYKKISKYGIWLARWTYSTKNFKNFGIPNVQMWQYSDKGKVSGIRTDVDLNILIQE